MTRYFGASVIVSALLICNARASAQICAGRHAFRDAHVQVGVTAGLSLEGAALGADLTVGGEHGLFGRGGATREYGSAGGRGVTTGGWVFSGTMGFQLRDEDSGRPRFCPMASVSRGTFNSAGIMQLVRTQFQIGGTFGFSTDPGAVSAIVPYAGFAVARMSYDLNVDEGAGMSLGSDTYVPITLGAGWHTKAFGLLVEWTAPVGLDGGERSFALRGVVPLSIR